MRFKDKVAIVTGGGQNIGKGVACGLAAEGGQVVIFDIAEDVAQETAAEIKSQGGEAIGLKVDVTKSQQVKDGVKQVVDRFGKVDILISNVGGSNIVQPFMQTTEEQWDDLIALNLKSQLICCHAVLENMVQRRYGKIVLTASDSGRMGTPGLAVYSACKGGVVGLTRVLAREMAQHNINVNSVSPGFVDTSQAREGYAGTPGEVERAIRKIPADRVWEPEETASLLLFLLSTAPMDRLGQIREIAAGFLFLASDDASFITGQTISVNGGLCMP